MINGVCPKCLTADVYRGVAAEGEGLTAGSYPAQIEIIAGQDQLALSLDAYLCRHCGYVELYTANPVELDWLPHAEGWVKVGVGR